MQININIIPIFRQKLNENTYHFDLVGINEDNFESYTLGYIIFNSKNGKYNCNLPASLNTSKFLSEKYINSIKEAITNIECTSSD